MVSLWYYVIVMFARLAMTVSMIDQELSGPMDHMGVDVGVMIDQVMQQHHIGCHLVLMSTSEHSPIFSSIIRLGVDILCLFLSRIIKH